MIWLAFIAGGAIGFIVGAVVAGSVVLNWWKAEVDTLRRSPPPARRVDPLRQQVRDLIQESRISN